MKNKYLQILMLLMFMVLVAIGSPNAKAASLDQIDYATLSGNRVQVRLVLSEPLDSEPLSFTVDSPARIALDFPGVTLNVENKNVPMGVGQVDSIIAVAAGDRTRVVVNLFTLVEYDLEVQGNEVLLLLGNAVGNGDTVVSGVADEYSAEHPDSDLSQGKSLTDIDFRRGENGAARIIVTLSDPTIGISMSQQGSKILVDFIDVKLPALLDRRLDVIDFATPVKEIDTSPNTAGAKMSITTINEQFEYVAYQISDSYVIEVKPLTKLEVEERAKQQFVGDKLSLNFQSIEVRAVLQILADVTELNLVVSDTVSGNLTLRLKNVPWDQALDIVLKARGLDKRFNGNVMLVAPQDEIIAREQLELEAQTQFQELSPLRTEYISISYAKASDIAQLIRAEENNLLSERGNVSVDARTNILIIQDTSTSLDAIRGLISELDVPVRQVLIESRIVNALDNFTKDIGVRFGYSRNQQGVGSDNGFYTIGGGRAGTTDYGGTTSFNTEGQENYIIDLPRAAPAGAELALAFGKIGSWLVQLRLSAAISEGTVEEIANPKVITANQREAVIQSGVEVPYQEATSSGATAVSFKEAVLGLTVTPQITPDDRVILDLKVSQDSLGDDSFGGVPTVQTRNVSTQVLVNNGETVVLGGVYTQRDSDSVQRVPFFSDIPYVGALFRNKSKELTKNELLIFVTPKILKDDLKI